MTFRYFQQTGPQIKWKTWCVLSGPFLLIKQVMFLCFGVPVIVKLYFPVLVNVRIIEANGGSPPLTYEMFCQVTKIVGAPPQPCPRPDFMGIDLPDPSTADDQFRIPTCEEMGKYRHTVSMQSVVVVTLLTLWIVPVWATILKLSVSLYELRCIQCYVASSDHNMIQYMFNESALASLLHFLVISSWVQPIYADKLFYCF